MNVKNNDHDRLDDIVRDALCQPMPLAVENQLRQRIEKARRHVAEQKQHVLTRRRFEWAYALPLVAAAVLLVGLLPWWMAPQSSLAFAEVQAAIREITTVAGRAHYPNAPQNDERGYMSADHKTIRAELPGGLVVVMSPNGKRLLLNAREKVAQVGPGQSPVDEEKVRHVLLELAKVEQTAAQALGSKEINGRRLEGFVIPSYLLRPALAKTVETRVWVDPATRLPVVIEQIPRDPKDAVAKVLQCVTTYELNVPLEDTLFSMTPPAGYRLVKEGEEFPLPKPVLPKDYGPDSLVVLPKQGMGKARFDMSLDDVIDAVGTPDWIDEFREPTPEQEKVVANLREKLSKNGAQKSKIQKQLQHVMDSAKPGGWVLTYRSLGFYMTVKREGGLAGIMCHGESDPAPYMGHFVVLNYGESFGAGVLRPFVGRTAEGITVNSTPEDVVEAYGEPTERASSKQGNALIYDETGLMLFVFVDGKLNNMMFMPQTRVK